MDHHVEHNDDYAALVVFSHPHHEDLVDPHDDGLPFYQGAPIPELGDDMKKDFHIRREISKHFLAAQIEFRKAYYDATNYANTPDIGRDTWYFARRFARAQGRAFLKNSGEAIRQVAVLFDILCALAAVRQAKKLEIDIFNLGNIIAVVCLAGVFLTDDVLIAHLLFFTAVVHLVFTYLPLIAYIFLGLAIEKGKNTLCKVRDAAWDGSLTMNDVGALDSWVFSILWFFAPEDVTPSGWWAL
ncbi:hypothetical protein CEP53_004231 [Fusarium sp. AF-6]|nr:hypothetical protein CEP53_004231 [Fusarium sp. AF-6]